MSDSTYIDSSLRLRGILKAKGQLVVIAGTFEGELEAGDVVIEEGGHCQGFLRANTVTVAGQFTGIIDSQSLTVSDGALVAGEIITQALIVDSGADISGTVMRKPASEPEKQAN
jgi:cytoskeletal protein CcmA (bactofilin family)